MFNRDDCGVVLGRCGRHKCVHFTCPTCDAKHDRGWVGYTPGTFRCLLVRQGRGTQLRAEMCTVVRNAAVAS